MNRSEIVRNYLKDQESVPFVWGKSDCMQFAAGCVERLTGTRPGTQYEYRTRGQADQITEGNLARLISAELGEPGTDMSQAFDGDVVISAFPDTGQICGIVLNNGAVFKGRRGHFMVISLDLCLMHWAVPCHRH